MLSWKNLSRSATNLWSPRVRPELDIVFFVKQLRKQREGPVDIVILHVPSFRRWTFARQRGRRRKRTCDWRRSDEIAHWGRGLEVWRSTITRRRATTTLVLKPSSPHASNPPTVKWTKRNIHVPLQPGPSVSPLADEASKFQDSNPYDLLRSTTCELFIENSKKTYPPVWPQTYSINSLQLCFKQAKMSCHNKERTSKDNDIRSNAVSNEMTRTAIENIKAAFHLSDNKHLHRGNKVAKIEHLYEEFNRVLLKQEHLSIHE